MTDQTTNPDDQEGPGFTLLYYPEKLAVVRFGPGAEVPDWAESSSVFSITATAVETSVVCAARNVPGKARSAGPYTAFVVQGVLDPSMVGVMHGLLGPLVGANVPVMTMSTFDTDWILVPTDRAEDAGQAWREAGHTVERAAVVVPPEPAAAKSRKRKK